ncbi:MAG: type II toxin-antitoxin system RelE family toxin [Dehalococcoidales bacterium]
MSYTILLERQAEKELRSLPSQMLRRIDKRLVVLTAEP